MRVSCAIMNSAANKKKDDEKERKFLGLLTYKLEYEFDKNAVN